MLAEHQGKSYSLPVYDQYEDEWIVYLGNIKTKRCKTSEEAIIATYEALGMEIPTIKFRTRYDSPSI